MQQVQSMYAGYDRSSSMGSKSRSILDSPEKATRPPPPLGPIHNSKPGSEGIYNSMLSMPILVEVREEQQQGQNIYAGYDRSSSMGSMSRSILDSPEKATRPSTWSNPQF